jgi:hypothetical protein
MSTNPVQLDFSKAVPINNPAQSQPAPTDAPVSLDFSKSQPISAPAPKSDEITINPSDSLLTKAAKTVGGLAEGVGEGVFGTVAGASDLSDKATGMQPGTVNSGLHILAGDNDQTHGMAQNIGRTGEDVAEFILGDSALKGLTVSDRLLQATKAAKLVEGSPVISRIVQAGVRALRGAAVAGTQGTVKSGGNVSEGAGAAVGAGLANAAIPEAVDAAKALPGALDTIKNVVKPGAIQDAFQGQIRGIVNDAAKEYGIDAANPQSIRDVAQQTSDSLLQKARQSYQTLDQITGGRVQRFRDAVSAVERKLANLNGISSPDDEGAWIEKLNDLQDAHEQAMQEATDALKAQGKSDTAEGVLQNADRDFRRSKAMLDLSKNIRASSEGLRPELANGAKKPIPETVNTGKLVNRVNKMYDSGRLQDALGKQRSDDLVRAVNDAHAASQTAQNWIRLAKTGARYAAYGTLPFGTYEVVRHLLGE